MHLLTVWAQYVDIIYMPAHEIELMKLRKKDPSLFGEKEGGIGASMRRGAEEKEYFTVDEGSTSDTVESDTEAAAPMSGSVAEESEDDFEGGLLGNMLEEEEKEVQDF